MTYKMFFLFLTAISILGCFKSNEFKFDIKSQTLCSNNDKGIFRLYIDNLKTDESYVIEWSTPEKIPPAKIHLHALNSGFKITSGYLEDEISTSKFRLKPTAFYRIERLQGDATAYQIMIRTDKLGLVDSVWR